MNKERIADNIAKGLLWFYGAAAVVVVGLAIGVAVGVAL